MEIDFVGAAQTVTGSKHLIRTPHANLLLDCGLFQGRRRESIAKNRQLGVNAGKVDAVILSHAHIDHSGALPLLVKNGFDGNIYTTNATRDLCAAMLMDAAMIQATDADYINKLVDRGEAGLDYVEPLYSEHDVLRVLERMVALPYRRPLPVAPGVTLTFLDAGHVLGSAITCLDIEDKKRMRRLVYTGDLGRRNMPILRDPEVPEGANVLITESTYGDRLHKPIEEMDAELAGIIKRVYERGGKLVIPSFALERAQELVYALHTLRGKGLLPKMRVYVDSPLTVKITEVFKLHLDAMDEETRQLMEGARSPFDFDELRYVSNREESKELSAATEPAIIISASGMCEAGRVLHHLKATVEDPKNCVVIVGYQAPHTLGRRIVEKRPKVRIFGVERHLRAEVAVLNGFSAHADQSDLLKYAMDTRDKGELEHIALVHGEANPQKQLSRLLAEQGFGAISIPAPGDTLEL